MCFVESFAYIFRGQSQFMDYACLKKHYMLQIILKILLFFQERLSTVDEHEK